MKHRAGSAFLLLLTAAAIFAAANSILAKIGDIGAHHLIHGRNPISFCNVLFAANLIAGLTLLAVHRKAWRLSKLAKIRQRDWWMMSALSLFSGVLGPALFFIGLMLTDVINVILISTLDIPLTLLFGYLISKEKAPWASIVGALFALSGVGVAFFLRAPDEHSMSMGMKLTMANIGTGSLGHFVASLPYAGEIMIALGTLITVVSGDVAKKLMAVVPAGVFAVYRTLFGTVAFSCIVLLVFGWHHFADLVSPFLWKWMFVYGGGVLALGLVLWYRALQATLSSDVAIANSVTPIAGVLFAYLLLHEVPALPQIVGGAFILAGIAFALVPKLRQPSTTPSQADQESSDAYIGI